MSHKRNSSRKKFLNITLVIPIYLQTKLVLFKQCIQSIFGSSKIPKEILICIDGEITKDLKIYLLQLKKKNIKFFVSKENLGLGALLNKSIKFCKYNLIARLDSDDFVHPKRFEIQFELFKKYKHLALTGGYVKEILNKKKTTTKKVPLTYSDIVKYSKFRNPFNHSTVMFKKNILLSVGNYKHQPFFEDFLLWIKIINKKFFVLNIPIILAYMNIDNNFLKRRSGKNYFFYYLSFIKKVYQLGHINIFIFFINIICRLVVFLPLKFLKIIYKNFLR